ncbi:MAG: transporter [Frankiales bacterium]|nr:transporter [Frankiales bacterium]
MTSPRSRVPHSSLALAAILGCQLMVVLDATIVNIALPKIQEDLGFNRADLSWVINAYALTFGGLLLLGARAGDLLGRRRSFLAGLTVFTVASLVGGLALEPWMLLASRAAQGVGAAFAAPSALALLMTSFPEGRARSKALGWYTAVSIGGAAVGLLLGGMLTAWASWRWVMFVNVPPGIALVLIARRVLPETERSHGRFDLPGALTSTLGMTALVFGFVRVATHGWSDGLTVAAFVSGVALLAAFVLVELRAESPVTPLRLFASRERSMSYVVRLLLLAGMQGMFFFLTQFMQDVLGYDAFQTGLGFLPLTAVVFLASMVSSRTLMNRFPPRRLILFGTTVSASGLAVLTQLSADSGYTAILIPLLMFAVGNGTAFVPMTALALSGVRQDDAGAASGLVNVIQQVGGSLGLSLLVTAFGTAARSSGEPAGSAAAFVSGADAAFVLAALMVGAAAVLTLVDDAIPRRRPVLVPAAEPSAAERAAATAGH